MKNLILCEDFYNDVNTISQLISNLEFTSCLYGYEIEKFYHIPSDLENMMSELLSENIEIQPNTGFFRKPNNLIYFDEFYQHARWCCIVALEDTELKILKHESGYKSFFDIQEDFNQFFVDNCYDQSKWISLNTINIRKNDFIFIRPWIWRSLLENKLIQMYLLNSKI